MFPTALVEGTANIIINTYIRIGTVNTAFYYMGRSSPKGALLGSHRRRKARSRSPAGAPESGGDTDSGGDEDDVKLGMKRKAASSSTFSMLVYVLLALSAVALWSAWRKDKAYHDMLRTANIEMRKKAEVVWESALEKLNRNSEDTEGDEEETDSDDGENRGDAEADEGSDDADDAYDAEGTEEDGGTEEDADDSAAAKLRLEAEQSRLKAEKRTEKMRKAQRETVQLNHRLNLMKERFKNGFEAADAPDSFVDTEEQKNADDALMSAFETELDDLVESWNDDAEKVTNGDEQVSSELLQSRKQQEEWETENLDALLASVQARIGVDLPRREEMFVNDDKWSVDDEGELVRKTISPVASIPVVLKPGERTEVAASEAEGNYDYYDDADKTAKHLPGIAQSVNLRGSNNAEGEPDAMAQPPPLNGDVTEEMASFLKLLENRISRPDAPLRAIVLGTKNYIGRDLRLYKSALTSAGVAIKFSAHYLKVHGYIKMAHKSVLSDDWTVLICLSLDSSKCFTNANVMRTKRYQKVNRIQGLREVLWNKDSFCKTLRKANRGNEKFLNYTFRCWMLPSEFSDISLYAGEHKNASYIVKPMKKGGGIGISVVDGVEGVQRVRHKKLIVQTYLHNPHLINQRKWDLRTYVLITSVNPIRAYVYDRGLVRFATTAYDPRAKRGGKKSQFLTNTSINKKNAKKGELSSITWSFEHLRNHFEENGQSYDELFARIRTAISIVLLSAEVSWEKFYKTQNAAGGIQYCSNCYQLMGVDLIVDDNMWPRVIEVNGEPSMALSDAEGSHYTQTKRLMMKHMTQIVLGRVSSVDTLSSDLHTIGHEDSKELSRRNFEYLLDYKRETSSLGGFKTVYPNRRDADLHADFLKMQTRIDAPKERLAVHAVLMELEKLRARSSADSP